MGRALRFVLAVLVALALAIGLLLFLQSRDHSTVGQRDGSAMMWV